MGAVALLEWPYGDGIRHRRAISFEMQRQVNEFYKKGCQEESSASTGGREDFGLEIQPTAVSVSPDSFERFFSGLFAVRLGLHLTLMTTPIES